MTQARPNIIFILADDLGYGDLPCLNPQSRIPTPHLDRLAGQGMCFTDAHGGSSVCTPSRYTLLTGQYAWRSRLKRGIVWQWDGPLIEPDQWTVARFLREQGYHTACLGKWHLGWNWPTLNGQHANQTLPYGVGAKELRQAFETNIDYGGRITGGPLERGFDSYFGVDVPNFPPYTWFQDDRLLLPPTMPKPSTMYGHPGQMAPGWELQRMIPEFTRRAIDLIEQQARTGQPYFLYFPLTSPHSPVVPNRPFIGRSGIGLYGDFVVEIDDLVGQIMSALERTGSAEQTLVIFASDNGPEARTHDDEGVYDRALRTEHYSAGGLRGIKRDAWEGGHRVPLLASWPKTIPQGQLCKQTVCLGDFFATVADLLGVKVPAGAAADSCSMAPLLRGDVDQPTRSHVIHHSGSGKFAVRKGSWVFIDAPSGGDNPESEWYRERRGYQPHDQPGELFRLDQDLPQRVNHYADRPDLVAEFKAILEQERNGPDSGISRESESQLTE